MSALLHSGSTVNFNPGLTYRVARMPIINSFERTKNKPYNLRVCGIPVTFKSAKRLRSACFGPPRRRKRCRQRPAPVVVPDEGPGAGGGVCSTAVDPGVPLGPGLLATCVMFHGPHVRTASASANAAAIMASVAPLMEPFRSSLSRMRFSTLVIGERRCAGDGSRRFPPGRAPEDHRGPG